MATKTQNSVSKGRILPHNIDNEQCVLGCILIDQDTGYTLLSELKEDDFYVEAHRIIYENMHNVYVRNVPVDLITLNDELEKNNMIDSVGGLEYLTTLTNTVPSAENFKYYLDMVKRDSVLRKLISSSQDIINKSYEGVTKEDAISFAESSIFQIAEKEDRGGLTHIDVAVDNAIAKMEEIQKEGGKVRGVPTGIYGLDKLTNGFQKGALILIAARPGCGKTSLGMNIIDYAATKGKKKCAIFSLEMSKEEIAHRCICSLAFVDSRKADKGEMDLKDWKAVNAASEVLRQADIYIDEGFSKSPVDIVSKCRRLKREKGLDVIMIDYLQLMGSGKKSDSRQQEVSDITRALKMAARELEVPIILLSQLSRNTEGRKDHRPILSDLRESGAIEQDADMVIFIYRADMYNDVPENEKVGDIAELIVAKNRSGPQDTIKVKWVGNITTFMNLEKDANAMSLETKEPMGKKPKPVANDVPQEMPPIEDIPFDVNDVPPLEDAVADVVPLDNNLDDIF